jgi:hypothetical protein
VFLPKPIERYNLLSSLNVTIAKAKTGDRIVESVNFFGFLWMIGNENEMNLKENTNIYLTVKLNPNTN